MTRTNQPSHHRGLCAQLDGGRRKEKLGGLAEVPSFYEQTMLMKIVGIIHVLLGSLLLFGECLRTQPERVLPKTTRKTFSSSYSFSPTNLKFRFSMSTQNTMSTSSPWEYLSSLFSSSNSMLTPSSSSEAAKLMAELQENITLNRDTLINAIDVRDASKSDAVVEALL